MNSTNLSSLTLSKTYWKESIYPWLMLLLVSSFLFYKYLLQVSPSVMVPELQSSFHLSGEQLGHLAACYFYSYMIMQLPGGLLLDRIRLRRLMSAAVMTCALGAACYGSAHSYFQLCMGRILIGLGGSFSAIGTMKMISLYFPTHRFALASGIMMTMGMLGAVGGQAPLSEAFAMFGWRMSLFGIGILGILLAITLSMSIRNEQATPKEPQSFTKLASQLRTLLSNPQCWLISIFSGLSFAPISAFGGLWGVPFLMSKITIDKSQAATLISLIFIGFAIGCPVSGWLSDYYRNRKRLMIIGTLLGSCLLSIIIYSPDPTHLTLGVLLFGFGFFTSFFFISFALIREINLAIIAGTAIGFINTFDAICGAISEPLIGHLLDRQLSHSMHSQFSYHHYQSALTLLPIIMLLSVIVLLPVKESHCQPTTNDQ